MIGAVVELYGSHHIVVMSLGQARLAWNRCSLGLGYSQ
jgi:hypothetical protein